MLRAGDLRDKVGFYQRGSANDGYGNTQTAYAEVATVTMRANIRPKLGGEQILAQRLTGTKLVNITVRQCAATAAITTDWRAKDERTGVFYNIRSKIDPPNEARGAFWEMLCEEGVAS